MNALSIASLVSAAPPSPVADGVLVFPVPTLLAWLVIGGVLAAACALIGVIAEPRRPWRAPRRLAPSPPRFGPLRPQPTRV